MYQSDAPFLSEINGGSQLRVAAVKLQNIAEVGFASGYFDAAKRANLVAFWNDQKARVKNTNGMPDDGVFLYLVCPDIRRLCYKVLSYIRIFGNNPANVAKWEGFCDFFANAANALTPPVPVTSVTATPTTLSGVVGGAGQLVASVLPADATDKKVTYASTDSAVATVDAVGKVTYVAEGSTNVTVSSTNGKTATVAVTVNAAPAAKNGVED